MNFWRATFALFSLLAVFALNRAGAEASGTRPNVLFLFSDDQRADTIAALGNAHLATPNLDRLAREGTSFSRAYCMGALQGAVCVPSRAMLLTGRSLFNVKGDLEGQTTWPEQFVAAGYSTFITGKWHNGAASVTRVFAQGKAIFLDGMTDPYAAPVQDIGEDRKLVNARTSGQHSVELFADAAIEFLRRQNSDRPFLCYVPFNAPHDPRVAPAEFHAPYRAAPPPLPPNFLPRHPFDNGALSLRDEELAPVPRTAEVIQQHLADYYAAITFMDSQIGRILAALRETGLAENTIIVFSSDHGLALGSHGLLGKQNLYEHSMRAPLIFSGPAILKGRRSDAFCYLFDVFATLGELAKVAAPAGDEGRSLAPILAGREVPGRDSIFTAYTDVQRAVRDSRWKLITYPKVNQTQLFDLQNDPDETRNLASIDAHGEQLKRMRQLLGASQREFRDPLADARAALP